MCVLFFQTSGKLPKSIVDFSSKIRKTAYAGFVREFIRFVCYRRSMWRRKNPWEREGEREGERYWHFRKWVLARVHVRVLRTAVRVPYISARRERISRSSPHTAIIIFLTPSLQPRESINQRSNRTPCFRRDESCCRFPTRNRYITRKGSSLSRLIPWSNRPWRK